MNNKKNLRKKILSERDGVEEYLREYKSNKIFERFITFSDENKFSSIFSYIHFRSEVKTNKIIELLLKNNKKVSLPKTYVKEKLIKAIPINGLESLQPGVYGIPEPEEIKIVSPKTLDCIIVPGAVFDRSGGRIGYGGGFYDRFFTKISDNTVKIGLSFDFQLKKNIPQEEHDVPLDIIITDKEIVRM